MAGARSPVVIMFVTVFVDLVGFGIVIPILPLYAERFGASPLVIGLLLSVYSLMQALAAPILGRLSDRIGRRPILLLSILGTSFGFLLMGVARTLPLLFIGRIIDGITGGNISTAQAYIADVTTPEERSKGMGLIGAAFGLGFILGPAIGGLLGHVSLAAPFFFAAALAFANAVALFFLLPESLPPARRHQAQAPSALRAVLEETTPWSLAVVLGTYFFTTVAFSLLTGTYSLFAEHRFRYTALQIGYIFAGQGLLGAVVQGVFIGRLVKAFGDRALVIAGTACLTVGLFLLPLCATTTALLCATGLIALGHSLVAAPLSGLASRQVGPAFQGRILGLMQSAASFARIVGPVMGGWLLSYDAAHLAGQFGRSAYWAGGAVMAVALGLAVALSHTSPAPARQR